uniref:Uncharacterized protein n=1 Tax=Romanomermis culicivorax TaxID=13658 RepID=A0A915JHZ7_ROMCU
MHIEKTTTTRKTAKKLFVKYNLVAVDFKSNVIKRMLVREPAKRATLKEIAALPWVKTGDFGHAQILPVISRDHVNDDLHEQIIEQMVVGNIASAEDICKTKIEKSGSWLNN